MNLLSTRRRLKKTASGRFLLGTMSLVYGAAVILRALSYRLKVLPSRALKVRTVCIGNLTVGGTGKTCAVLTAAKVLHRKKLRTAILSRGHGRLSRRREVAVLLDSRDDPPWQETGDEPRMMHEELKGLEVPILVCPDRWRAGRTAIMYYDPQVILLDDGFQHLRLRRDADIVLISALDPFGGRRLLPLGDLREPARALRRATLAMITHIDQVPPETVKGIRAELLKIHPGLKIAEAVHVPDAFHDVKTGQRLPLTHLKDREAACFSAIGTPEAFEATLKGLGTRLEQVWRFPDHHPYTEQDARAIGNLLSGRPVVTTLKDCARLPSGWRGLLPGEVLALGVRLEVTHGKQLWEETLCDGIGRAP